MDEATARTILAGKRAQALVDVVDYGWSQMVAEGYPRTRRTRANIVWDYMIEAAEQEVEPLPGVHRIVRYQIPMFVFDQQLVLRFKKHDQQLLYANVRTGHQRDIAQQLTMGGLPPDYLTCGYQLDQAEAAIERIVVVRHVNQQVDWFIDLRELVAGQLAPSKPALPIVPAVPTTATLPTIAPAAKEEGDQE